MPPPAFVLSLPPQPSKAPKRRFRGKRRYFRKLHREAASFRLDVDPPCWWDHWHRHVDWLGWGNLGWRCRREHLRALAVIFRTVVETAPSIPVPFQTWILVDEGDAGMDAVYVHSPNPNRSNFPFRPGDMANAAAATSGRPSSSGEGTSRTEGCSWETPAAAGDFFASLLPGSRLRVGRCTWIGEGDDGAPCTNTSYFIYSPDVGIPLE